MDFNTHRWEAFPWKEEEYREVAHFNSERGARNAELAGASSPRLLQEPQSPSEQMAERVRAYARRYWRERLNWELNGAEGEPATPRVIEAPVDRTLFVQRDPRATPKQLDLTRFYTGELGEIFHPRTDHGTEGGDDDLSELPTGLLKLDGVEFDVRGAIQVRRSEPLGRPWDLTSSDDPVQVEGIPLHQEAGRLRLLLGSSGAELGIADGSGRTIRRDVEGKVIGKLVLHYVDGETASLDLVYGRDVRDWWYDPAKADSETTDRAKVVWTGANPLASYYGRRLRLYLNTRENPRPGVKITTFDFISTLTTSAPFLIAVTVE